MFGVPAFLLVAIFGCVSAASENCEDLYAYCGSWDGLCTSTDPDIRDFVSKNCRKTCGLCEETNDEEGSTPDEDCDEVTESHFESNDNRHVSYGIPHKDITTLCDCMKKCVENNECKGVDYNFDDPPYQDTHCWIHEQEGELIEPYMDVSHFTKKVEKE